MNIKLGKAWLTTVWNNETDRATHTIYNMIRALQCIQSSYYDKNWFRLMAQLLRNIDEIIPFHQYALTYL